MLGMVWAELKKVGGASSLDPSLMGVRVRLTEKEVWAWATHETRIWDTHMRHMSNRDTFYGLPEAVKDPLELR